MSKDLVSFTEGRSLLPRRDNFWHEPTSSNIKPYTILSKKIVRLNIDGNKLAQKKTGYTVAELRQFMAIINETHGNIIKETSKGGIRDAILHLYNTNQLNLK